MLVHFGSRSYHDNTRRTESTLTSIAFCDSFLCWMWSGHVAYALDCNDMFAIHAHKRCKTGIHRCMVDLLRGWIVLGDDLSNISVKNDTMTRMKHTTVQAPHPPSAHPSFVPVSPTPLRYSKRVTSGSAVSKTTFVPFK